MHTSVFIVSLSKWSLISKIIYGVPPRIDLILLVLICRVTPNNYKVEGTDTISTSHQPYICMDIYVVHPKNYENKYKTIQCTKLYSPRFGLSTFCMSTFVVGRCFAISTFWFGLVCRRFGLSTFRSVDALVCWCFGMSTFWFVAALVLVCRHCGMSVFRFVDVLVVDVSVCRRFDQLPTKGSTLTHQIMFINMVIILQTTYQNGFLHWHFS